MSKNYTFYRLFNLNLEECYVGSTTNYKKRLINHKACCNNPNSNRHNLKLYKFIRANGGLDQWQFEIIEEQELNKKEALNIENEYRMIYGATLNTQVPSRTKKEYHLANKDIIIEQQKQYRLDNKEHILERNKQYYLDNKDQCKQYYLDNKDKSSERRKQYYLDNKKKIRDQYKQYYLDNKDKISERQKQYYLNNKDKKK